MDSPSDGSSRKDADRMCCAPQEFQKYFGLSRSSLMMYEKAGVTTPPRNSENDYRVITMTNGVKMSNGLTFARYGMHLKDVGRLVNDCSDEDRLALFREQDAELGHEVLTLIAKRARLEELIQHLVRLKNNPKGCELVQDCDLYLLDTYDEKLKFNSNQSYAAEWWANAPFVTEGAIVSLDTEGNCIEMLHGPLATGGSVRKFGLPTENALHFCIPRNCYLSGYVVVPIEECPTRRTYAHLIAYADANDITLDISRVLHMLLYCHDIDDVPMRYDVVYIPLKEPNV